MEEKIITALRNYQQRHKLSDTKFATAGADKFAWSHIKAGRRPPNKEFLVRIGTQHPALQKAITEYLFPRVPKTSVRIKRLFRTEAALND